MTRDVLEYQGNPARSERLSVPVEIEIGTEPGFDHDFVAGVDLEEGKDSARRILRSLLPDDLFRVNGCSAMLASPNQGFRMT